MQPNRMTTERKRTTRFRTRRLTTAATTLGVAGAAGVTGESAASIIHTPIGSPDLITLQVDGTIYSQFDIISNTGMMGSLSLDDTDVAGMMVPTSTIEFAFIQPGGGGPRYLQDMSFNVESIDLRVREMFWSARFASSADRMFSRDFSVFAMS